ncbi:hypothetical protein [Methylocystis parvus]|uniref:Uncharacterized protein n=1 Tax=Methylocystis parvus TaxID=134 RepID=A0A6B8M9K5_9HYPH|nr:hypothetical protein [Methylocystis parvus]QGM99356.1 hypothetical protein F7D14_18965 [Methylocystis parvus]WBK00252.1 hypothetical protein MMG94_00570 [Methylocystis parvus OBBP]
MDKGDQEEKHKLDVTPISLIFDPMEQMRELLFGATHRETGKELARLEQKLETFQKDFAAQVEALDARLLQIAREAEKSQAESLMTIGNALSELGERLKAMSEKRDV